MPSRYPVEVRKQVVELAPSNPAWLNMARRRWLGECVAPFAALAGWLGRWSSRSPRWAGASRQNARTGSFRAAARWGHRGAARRGR